MSKTIAAVLTSDVDLQGLLDRLGFDEDGVRVAAMEQAKLFHQVAILRVQQLRKRAGAKTALEVVRSGAYLAVRQHYEKTGTKGSEATFQAEVAKHAKVQAAEEAFRHAEEEEEYIKLVVDAFRQRAQQLRVIGDLVEAEISLSSSAVRSAQNEVGLAETREELSTKYPGATSAPAKKTTRKRSK